MCSQCECQSLISTLHPSICFFLRVSPCKPLIIAFCAGAGTDMFCFVLLKVWLKGSSVNILLWTRQSFFLCSGIAATAMDESLFLLPCKTGVWALLSETKLKEITKSQQQLVRLPLFLFLTDTMTERETEASCCIAQALKDTPVGFKVVRLVLLLIYTPKVFVS